MKNYRFLIALFGILIMSASHAQDRITKVTVLKSGALFVNGKPTTLHSIDAEFAKLKNAGGQVWYYRENAQAEPPKEAVALIELVIKHSLPVSMSSKPDFSDYIDENGHSKLRKP